TVFAFNSRSTTQIYTLSLHDALPISLKTTALTSEQKSALEASVAPGDQVVWFDTLRERWRVARLMFRNAKLRFTMREAFEVHRRSEEHTSELQSPCNLVCRLLLEKKK